MCIIVDTNQLSEFLSKPASEDAAPIRHWLKGRGLLVYSTGGKFAKELSTRSKIRLKGYVDAGRAKLIPAMKFRDDEISLRKDSSVRSNDHHVLALARHSGARVLYTSDKNLMDDFTNKKLIDNPRGKVYRSRKHFKLLTRSTCRSNR